MNRTGYEPDEWKDDDCGSTFVIEESSPANAGTSKIRCLSRVLLCRSVDQLQETGWIVLFSPLIDCQLTPNCIRACRYTVESLLSTIHPSQQFLPPL